MTTTGFVDVFVCGEYLPPADRLSLARATPAIGAGCITTRATARSRTSPPAAGVTDERCAKGSAWGDYDGDGRLDLFVSNMGQPCRLVPQRRERQVPRRRPRAWRHRRRFQLRLLVLGLRQRRSSRPLRQRLPGTDRRGPLQRHGIEDRGVEPAPPLPQPRSRRLPRCLRRGRSRPGHGADGRELRRHRQRRLPRHLPGNRRHVVRGPGRQPHVQERRWAIDSRTSPQARAPAIFRRGTASRLPTGTATATSTCSSSSAARRPATRAYNALFQNPGQGRHWLKVKLVGTKTNRAALGAQIRVDLSLRRRAESFDLPHGRQQFQLRRQQPGRDDRPDRCPLRVQAHCLLADQPDDTNVSRYPCRPGDRDRRGFRLLQDPPASTGISAWDTAIGKPQACIASPAPKHCSVRAVCPLSRRFRAS